jgi:anaerobic magnesium-protoporphyrin IX monomethyl ester cyclase
MIQQEIGLEWTCQTRVDNVDSQLLADMSRAGCRMIQFGVESGDDRVLQEMHKETSVAQVRQAFRDAKRQGLRTTGFFILGWPGESRESINRTMKLAVELNCDYASFTLPMPHAGTWLGIKMGPEKRKLPYNDVTPETAEQAAVIRKAYRRFYLRPRYLVKRLLSSRNGYEFSMQVRMFFSMLQGLLTRSD